MDVAMKNVYALFVIVCIGISLTNVSGKESRLLWGLDELATSRSCVYSISGDPTEWVSSLNVDSKFEVTADPLCVDRQLIQIGPLAVNPVVPDVVVSSDRLDNGLVYFEATEEGDVQIFFGGSQNVTAIAFDYQSQNVYYTDPVIGLVLVQYAVSRPYFSILLEGLDDPHSVVVDPDAGYLFWAEATVLKRSNLVGGSIVQLLSGLSRSSLLTLDRETQDLFVLDEEAGTLRSISYDGQSAATLIEDPANIDPGTFAGIVADQGYLFATLANEATIVIWNQTTGVRQADLGFPVSLATQHGITATSVEPMQPTGLCQQNKGGCGHICVHISDSSRVCRCNMGYTLNSDGVTCSSSYLRNKFLLVSDIGADKLYQIDLRSSEVHGIPVQRTNNQRIEAVVYDPVGHQVIWMDTGNGTLRGLGLAIGRSERVIYTFASDSGSIVQGIAIHPTDRHIYYTDMGLSQIGRISIDSGVQELIWALTPQESPLQIQVDTVTGYIYWTNVGTPATIERGSLDRRRLTLVSTDIQTPSGLVLNTEKQELYWADETLERLEKINVDGSGREMIQAAEAAYSLAADNNYIYIAKAHQVRRYSIGGEPQSTLGPKIFSLLYGLHLYSAPVTTEPTTTTTTTSSPGSSDASTITGVFSHIVTAWFLLWISKLM